ncbi:MAG: response regulator [Deltaproteobacteria bacterium]|nr:response regulator [Deltaproteobacteria bacterium]
MDNKALTKWNPKQGEVDDNSSAKEQRPPTIAIIDDDIHLVHAISRILKAHHQCTVNGYPSVEEFLLAVDKGKADDVSLILLDFHLPGQSGPKLVEELRKRRSHLLANSYILGMTGDPEKIVHNEFQDAGIEEIIQKPLQKFDYKKISKIAHAVKEHNANLAYQADYNDESTMEPNIIKRYI